MSALLRQNNEIAELRKGVHWMDLGESFPTNIWLQKSDSIQPRTSPVKFFCAGRPLCFDFDLPPPAWVNRTGKSQDPADRGLLGGELRESDSDCIDLWFIPPKRWTDELLMNLLMNFSATSPEILAEICRISEKFQQHSIILCNPKILWSSGENRESIRWNFDELNSNSILAHILKTRQNEWTFENSVSN